MSRTFYFGNATKRKNSTLQPTGISNGYDVLFKNPTSLDNPTITLNHSGDFTYNYAKYDNNYYFVRDKVARNNDLWEVTLELDALATHKADVLNTTAYVIYDSVANTEIPDNRLPMKTTKSVSANTAACPFVPDGGCYILSLTGSNGSTGVYKVSSSELASLIDDLSDVTNNIWDFGSLTPPSAPSKPGSQDLWDWLEYVGDCLGYIAGWIVYAIQCAIRPVSQFFGSQDIPSNIRECRYIPFNVGTTYGPTSPVYLGTFESNSSLSKLNTDTVHRTTSVSIPWQATDYRRRSPYTELYLYLPYIGMVRLSSENLIDQSSINVAYTLCVRDGSLIVTVSSGSEIIGQYSGNVAASVPVGISNINIPKASQSLIGAVAAAATGNIAAAGMAAISFGDAVTPNYSCIGGLDGIAAIATNQNITCYSVFHDTVAAPNQNLAVIGAPTMASKSLSGLTGYVQCMDAHVAANADAPILEELDRFLNSGFYIE